MSVLRDTQIARSLPTVWDAFFARFGRLTPIQRESIPLILEGRDVLVVSPTASGKTEAAAAPLIERFAQRREPWSILYVSPTRALVNDLYERLSQPLDLLPFRIGRRTGEYKSNLLGVNIILTTPESFDSLLCRGSIPERGSHVLASVSAVVIDEIHLILGTPRGEQLRWLIKRLMRVREQAMEQGLTSDKHVQVIGLSATVPDPKQVVDSFFPGGVVTRIPGTREITTVEIPSPNSSTEKSLPAYVKSLAAPEKILVFSNTRKRVDLLTQQMSRQLVKLGYLVRSHHASLSKRERETTEQILKDQENVIVFATMTLELGIDIGDIDLVVLDGPAPDMQSLFQRIGRGNRRTGTTRVMACSNSYMEALIQSSMLQAAITGWLGASRNGPHMAVARQQIASYIYQSPRGSRPKIKLENFLSAGGMNALAGPILEKMIDVGELENKERGITLSQYWQERSENGQIHTNIEDPPGTKVVDEETGELIATGLSYQKGVGLGVGGRLLQVRDWKDWKLEVRNVKDPTLAEGSWGYVWKSWFRGPDQPQGLKRFLEFENEEWPVVTQGELTHVFHFGGTTRKIIINLLSDVLLLAKHREANEWYFSLPTEIVKCGALLEGIQSSMITSRIDDKLDFLERALGRPSANKNLPLLARRAEILGWLDIERELDILHNANWIEVRDEEQTKVLRSIIALV